MLSLLKAQPFAKGSMRLVYVHPHNPDLCVKVPSRPDDPRCRKAQRRELRDWAWLQRWGRKAWFDRIPTIEGVVSTDLGEGIVSRLYRDESGRIATSLVQTLRAEGLTPSLTQAIDEFEEWPETAPTSNLGHRTAQHRRHPSTRRPVGALHRRRMGTPSVSPVFRGVSTSPATQWPNGRSASSGDALPPSRDLLTAHPTNNGRHASYIRHQPRPSSGSTRENFRRSGRVGIGVDSRSGDRCPRPDRPKAAASSDSRSLVADPRARSRIDRLRHESPAGDADLLDRDRCRRRALPRRRR